MVNFVSIVAPQKLARTRRPFGIFFVGGVDVVPEEGLDESDSAVSRLSRNPRAQAQSTQACGKYTFGVWNAVVGARNLAVQLSAMDWVEVCVVDKEIIVTEVDAPRLSVETPTTETNETNETNETPAPGLLERVFRRLERERESGDAAVADEAARGAPVDSGGGGALAKVEEEPPAPVVAGPPDDSTAATLEALKAASRPPAPSSVPIKGGGKKKRRKEKKKGNPVAARRSGVQTP